jgi:two-component system, NarL family, response regulator DegU
MSDPIEIVVVEDDPSTLKSLVRLLGSYPEIRVVGSALSGESGLETIRALSPQLVLLDLELPGIDGIEVTRRIMALGAGIEVLILTSFEDEVKVFQCVSAGASGYLVKRFAAEKIRAAIDEVLRGGTVIEPRIARRFWNYFQSQKGAPTEAPGGVLEPIERDILQMIGKGLTNQQAGEVLQLERRTVRTHLAKIYQKLGTSNRSEAVVIALRRGLINL